MNFLYFSFSAWRFFYSCVLDPEGCQISSEEFSDLINFPDVSRKYNSNSSRCDFFLNGERIAFCLR